LEKSVKVWDPLVRIFHWSLVALFITAYLTAEEFEGTHALAGYAISGLLVFRFVWGFLGTEHARFIDFVYPPREIAGYLKGLLSADRKRYLGHNPAGGLMVVILLIALSATCFSGLKAYGEEGRGPFAGEGHLLISTAYADGDGDGENSSEQKKDEEFWEEIHEVFVNGTLILVAIHIIGVVASSYLHKENLIKAMITGRKEISG
jgi:cytochrome b